jgi:hypothetical protein
MGRSESPEKQAKILDSQVRQVEADLIVQDILDRGINGKGR